MSTQRASIMNLMEIHREDVALAGALDHGACCPTTAADVARMESVGVDGPASRPNLGFLRACDARTGRLVALPDVASAALGLMRKAQDDGAQ